MTRADVRWTIPALAGLESIGGYIGRRDARAALAVVARLMAAAERLATLPHSGRPGRVAGTRELVLADIPYIIAYRVADDGIAILAVMHTSQRWPSEF